MKKNTLSRLETSSFYNQPDGFELVCKEWKLAVNQGFEPSAADMLLYSIIRGKNYLKGFSPITNEVKLANGYKKYSSLAENISRLVRSRYYNPPEFLIDLLSPNWRKSVEVYSGWPNVIVNIEDGCYEVKECIMSTCS